jgi:hypothetical protein
MEPTTNVEEVEMDFITYANAFGSLMDLIMCTILNLAFSVGHVAQFMSNLGSLHQVVMKRVF